MKLQYLAAIFVIIILPIALVLGLYMQTQIEIINTQTNYTSKINDATHDAVKAFQLNTTNSYYASVSDSKIRDIEASVNTFYNSLTSSLNYSKNELQAYVPAIVYTLYDGYYIYGKRYNVYSETKLNSSGELTGMTIDTELPLPPGSESGLDDTDKYQYGLKPFVYYSCRYYRDSKNDFVVNFTLDNFISIYGTIKGRYVTKSGYLIDINEWDSKNYTYKGAFIEENETLSEYLVFEKRATGGIGNGEYRYIIHNSQKIYYTDNGIYFWYDQGVAHTIQEATTRAAIRKIITSSEGSARKYYQEAAQFSQWVNDTLGTGTGSLKIQQKDIKLATDKETLEFDAQEEYLFDMTQDPENPGSIFDQHRVAVIKNSIKTNLITAINSYNSNASSYEYALPQLTEEDWDKVVNNVCMITFVQGLPMGGKYFNNYVVIPNDKNNEFVDIDAIYLLTDDGQYHIPNCPDLVESKDYQDKIHTSKGSGYINTSFTRQNVEDSSYYYRHAYKASLLDVRYYTGCYHCVVSASGRYDLQEIMDAKSNKIDKYDITILRSKYLTILARERYNLYKTNN